MEIVKQLNTEKKTDFEHPKEKTEKKSKHRVLEKSCASFLGKIQAYGGAGRPREAQGGPGRPSEKG